MSRALLGLWIAAGALACRSSETPVPAAAPPAVEPVAVPVAAVFEHLAMGVRFQIAFGAGEVEGRVVLVERCFAEVRRLERLLSIWSPDSALARLNATPGTAAVPVDPELALALEAALDFCVASRGAFDPTVATILRRLGFYDQVDVPPLSEEELGPLRARVGCGRARVVRGPDGEAAVVRAVDGVELDLSGLAKGWAVDRVVAMLRAAGVENAYVAASGSTVFGMGDAPDGRGWPVRVPGAEGPRVWRLRDEALATSGRLAFEVVEGGLQRSHVVDPATGRPTGSRTELAVFRGPSASEADMAATALVAMGPEAARDWFPGAFDARRAALLVVGAEREIVRLRGS